MVLIGAVGQVVDGHGQFGRLATADEEGGVACYSYQGVGRSGGLGGVGGVAVALGKVVFAVQFDTCSSQQPTYRRQAVGHPCRGLCGRNERQIACLVGLMPLLCVKE